MKKSAALLLLCVCAALASLRMGQDASWDLQNYHLYDAFTLLHAERWRDFNFAQSQSYLNPIFDVPLAVLDALFPQHSKLVAIVMGLPFAALAFFSLRLSRRLFAGQPHALWAAALAIILGLTGSATISQIGLSSNEVLVAALIIAALDIWLAAPDRPGNVAVAGLLAGLATGGKLTAAPYAIGLAAALIAALPVRRLPAALATLAAAGLAGVLLTGGFWMFHLWTIYGDPIFPYGNQIFKSPWAGAYAYNDTRFFPRSWPQALIYPFEWIRRNDFLVTEKPFADARIAAVFAVSAVALAVAAVRRGMRWPPLAWRAVAVFWLLSYILWEKAFSIYRYAIPLEITGAAIIIAACRAIAPGRPARATAAASLLTLLLCGATVYPNWGHIRFQARAVPVTLPPIAPGTLVAAIDSNGVSFTATAAPPGVTFIGVNNNFVFPDTTIMWSRLASIIATWPGPISVIEPAAGDQPAEAYIGAVYNLTVTGPCQPISTAYVLAGYKLCAARRGAGPSPYQPDMALTFGKSGNGKPYLYPGWFHPDQTFRWSIGATASLLLPTNPANRNPLHLAVLAFAYPLNGQPRMIDVLENGAFITQWHVGPAATVYLATLPAPTAPNMELTFRVDDYTTRKPWGIALMAVQIKEKLF